MTVPESPDFDVITEAFSRLKKITPLEGDARFIYSKRLLDMIDVVKKERKGGRENPAQQAQTKVEVPAEPTDTNPPPEPRTETSRVPSREELFYLLKYMDRARIEPLYHAVDDLVNELKVVSDKQKSQEDKIKSLEDKLGLSDVTVNT
jgi:hypothetical protein